MDSTHPDQEGFGEASLGEAQSSNPPEDPEMIRDSAEDGPPADESPEEFAADLESDPARNPDDDRLDDIKGG